MKNNRSKVNKDKIWEVNSISEETLVVEIKIEELMKYTDIDRLKPTDYTLYLCGRYVKDIYR